MVIVRDRNNQGKLLLSIYANLQRRVMSETEEWSSRSKPETI